MISDSPKNEGECPEDIEKNKQEDEKSESKKDEVNSLSGDDEDDGSDSAAHVTSMMNKGSKQRVMVPGGSDVLLGRGKPFQSHQGNQLMLQLVDQFRSNYVKADRKGKHMIIEQVLSFIKERGGRFLMRVDYENYWVEVKRSISYRKVGHAFRSKARRTKKLSPAPSGMKIPNGLFNPSSLELEMLAANRSRLSHQLSPAIQSAIAGGNPLLGLPKRLANTNLLLQQQQLQQQQLQQQQQEMVLNEMIAMERLEAQKDAMRRRLQTQQSMGALQVGAPGSSLGLMGAPSSMDELLLLERMQGRANNASLLERRMNGNGLLSNNMGIFGSQALLNQGALQGKMF